MSDQRKLERQQIIAAIIADLHKIGSPTLTGYVREGLTGGGQFEHMATRFERVAEVIRKHAR